MSCVGGLERRETFPENPLALPCFIGSLSALRKGESFVLVRLLIPNNGVTAWVEKEDLTITKQSVADGKLKGFLKSNIVGEREKAYTVEIMDRGRDREIEVPKDWLERETTVFSRQQG